MSEKYTINSEYDICLDGKVYIANKNLNSLCYITLFCRLLNEDEKRKRQPRIDSDFKQQMLNHFNSLQIKNSNNWIYNQYQILIKHIESLECETDPIEDLKKLDRISEME